MFTLDRASQMTAQVPSGGPYGDTEDRRPPSSQTELLLQRQKCKTNIQEPRRAGWRIERPSAGHLPHGKLICGTMRVWSKVASLATSVFACSFVSARYNGAEGADSDPYEPVNRKPNLTATLAARPNREAWLLGRE